MAIVAWDGGGGDTNWHNPLNWGSDYVPGAADDVEISNTSVTITLTAASDVTINSVTSAAGIALAGGVFSTSANWSITR